MALQWSWKGHYLRISHVSLPALQNFWRCWSLCKTNWCAEAILTDRYDTSPFTMPEGSHEQTTLKDTFDLGWLNMNQYDNPIDISQHGLSLALMSPALFFSVVCFSETGGETQESQRPITSRKLWEYYRFVHSCEIQHEINPYLLTRFLNSSSYYLVIEGMRLA